MMTESVIDDDFIVEESWLCCCFRRSKKPDENGIRGLRYEVGDHEKDDRSGAGGSHGLHHQGVVNLGFQGDRRASRDSFNVLGDTESLRRVVLFRLPGWAALAIATYKERANREFTMNAMLLSGDSQNAGNFEAIRELEEAAELDGGVVPIDEYAKAHEGEPSTSASPLPKRAEVVFAKRSIF